jgi:CSLREA domain-containing protein
MFGRSRFTLAAVVAALSLAVAAAPASASSLTVTTTDDGVNADGACSLREAIANANQDNQSGSAACVAGSGADTIGFGSLAGTITLTAGELTISAADGLTIDGGDAITVSGNDASRVLSVAAGVQLTLRNLTVADGRVDFEHGGGVYNAGTLSVTDSKMLNNDAGGGSGGAIMNVGGTVTVSGSVLDGTVRFPLHERLAGRSGT